MQAVRESVQDVSEIAGVTCPEVIFVNESSMLMESAVNKVMASFEPEGEYGVLCADLGGTELRLYATHMVGDEQKAPGFSVSFDVGADTCFYHPYLKVDAIAHEKNPDQKPKLESWKSESGPSARAAAEFGDLLNGTLASKYYSPEHSAYGRLTTYHAVLSYLVTTHAQHFRSLLYREDLNKGIPVYVVLSGDGWLWFPEDRRLLPKNPQRTGMFSRARDADAVVVVDESVEDPEMARLVRHSEREVEAMPADRVIYMSKREVLTVSCGCSYSFTRESHPVGLSAMLPEKDGGSVMLWNQASTKRNPKPDPVDQDPRSLCERTPPDEPLLSILAQSRDHGVFVHAGPWSYVPGDGPVVIHPDGRRLRAADPLPEEIESMIAVWGEWVQSSAGNPDSFAVFLATELCDELKRHE